MTNVNKQLDEILGLVREQRDDLTPIRFSPEDATVYFDLNFDESKLEEDLDGENGPERQRDAEWYVNIWSPDGAYHSDLFNKSNGPWWSVFEAEALKEISAMLGVKVQHPRRGHRGSTSPPPEAGGPLVCKFGVDTPQDVFRVADIVRTNSRGGDDVISLNAPYTEASGFLFYPWLVHGDRPHQSRDGYGWFNLVDITPETHRFIEQEEFRFVDGIITYDE